MRKFIFFTFLILSFKIYSQDTISVFFGFGKSNLTEIEEKKLGELRTKFVYSELDSVYFIGTTDSIGDLKSNIKLSTKRANKVYDYIKNLFPEATLVKLMSKGELTDKIGLEENRKVVIIFFFKKEDQASSFDIKQLDSINSGVLCYTVDYHLLHRSNIRTILKGKKEFISLEVLPNYLKTRESHYYASKNKKGLVFTKVKWKDNKALIPKIDFEKYRILKTGTKNCSDTCKEDLSGNQLLKNETCIQRDDFLMLKVQYKPLFFNMNFILVRAYKEYINPNAKYYYGCSFYPLIWKSKRFFNKKDFYYAKMPLNNLFGSNIMREMDCCKNFQEKNRCDYPTEYFGCASRGKNLSSNLFLGYNTFSRNHEAVLGLNLHLNNEWNEIILVLGGELNRNLYSSLTYNFDFIHFPYATINPIAGWDSKYNSLGFGRLFVGTELRSLEGLGPLNYLDQNIHFGFSTYTDARLNFSMQYGIAFDYFGNISNKPYGIFQANTTYRILKFSKN